MAEEGVLDLFVVCAPGLEPLTAAEIAALGLEGRAVPGGVELRGDLRAVARLNLWLRTATRVLVRLGSFGARTFPELVHKAKELRWESVLERGAPVALRVTCRKSKLYHSDAVAERLRAALSARLGAEAPEAAPPAAGPDDDGAGAQLILARFDRDVCTVSADASGALLHQRGYRRSPGTAPLRETLAAALLLSAGYDGSAPLCDPLCGSGTIAIEAALIASGRAPGERRIFALQRWPGAPRPEPAPAPRPLRAKIEASDQDAAAVQAARENAERAGVEIAIAQRALADLPAAAGAGLVATNPPYGVRVGGDLPGLYRELGEVLRARRPGFRLALVSPDERLARATGVELLRKVGTGNGGIPIALLSSGG